MPVNSDVGITNTSGNLQVIMSNLGTVNEDASEIKALKRTVWRSAISTRVERFSELLEREDFQKSFGQQFVEEITAKIDRLFRVILLLGLAYTVLMLSLFVAQDAKKTEFEIFGYGFKNLASHKEFLLLLAAAISPISSTFSAYHRYLVQLRAAALKQIFPDADIREFYSHAYATNFSEALVHDVRGDHRRPHGLTLFLLATFAIVLGSLFVAFLVASFILQIVVIHDVATNPASPKYVNVFVVFFSLTAIGLSWIIGVLQLPLPEVDVSAYKALNLLKEKDKRRYDETMTRIAKESARRERIWSLGSSIVIFLLIYLGAAVLIYPSALLSVISLMARAIPGLLAAAFVATVVVSGIKRALHRRYFHMYPGDLDKDLKAFSQLTRRIRTLRLGFPAVISILYAVLSLRD